MIKNIGKFLFNKKMLFYFSIFMAFFIGAMIIPFFIVPDKYNYKKNFKKIANLGLDVEKSVLDNISESSNTNSKKDLNNQVALEEKFNIDMQKIPVTDLQTLYLALSSNGTSKSSLYVLEQIYKQTNDFNLLYLLIEKSIQIYDYDKAFLYVKKIYEQDSDLKNFDIDLFFQILFNVAKFDKNGLEEIDNFLNLFHDSGRLSDQKFDYYQTMFLILKNDKESLKPYLSKLSGNEYSLYIQDINFALNTFSQYKDVPDYYLDALFGFVFFKHGFFGFSQYLSQKALLQNGKYILPIQILAYIHFLQEDSIQATKYLEQLIKIDSSNADNYKFLIGVNSFWDKNYEKAISIFLGISSENNLKDIYRYLILSYYNQKNFEKMIEYWQKLKNIGNLTEYDFFTFFDVFLYDKLAGGNNDLLQKYSNLFLDYIQDCYEKFDNKTNFVCRYGKGLFYANIGEQENALQYMMFLANKYPKSHIFKYLGDWYLQNKDIETAKKYYLKAVLYADDLAQKQLLKSKMAEKFY